VNFIRNILAGVALAVLVFPATVERSFAATNLGLATISWVASVDATPGWSAYMRGLSVDEENAAVSIETLVVAAEAGGIVVEIEGARLAGFAEIPGGGFTAVSLEAARLTLKTHSADLFLTDIAFDDIGVPALSAIAYDKFKPFSAFVSAYSAIAESRALQGRIAQADLIERFEGHDSRISYENIAFAKLADGKIESVRAGPLKLTSPSPISLAEITVKEVDAQDIDIDAFLHVYDSRRYIDGIGDNIWHRAIAKADYSDMTITLPGVMLTLGSIAVEDLKLRQPAESFSPLINAMMSENEIPPSVMDALTSRYIGGLLSAFGAGRFTVKQFALAATGIDQFTMETFGLSNVSNDGFREAKIEGFIGAIAGQGAIGIGRLALGDVDLPSFDAFEIALARAERGGDIDISSLLPRLGAFEVAGVNVQAINFPGVTLGRLRADLGNYLGEVPTEVALDIENLDIATSSLQPARARSFITSLGYERIRADANFDLGWLESDGSVKLDELRIDIEDFGNITASLLLTGLTREAIESPDGAAGILADLLFNGASVSFEDKSVVERSLSMRADLLNIPLDRLRNQLSGALPLMLAFVGDADLVKEIVPVLQTFIKTPGTLTIEATPDNPVPVAAIEESLRRRPQNLPAMLAISISGKPGI
jgi:hypothetical protein